MDIHASDLNPLKNLDGKHNYRIYYLVDSMGNYKKRIILSVPDMQLRETIICNHFMSRHVKFFVREVVGVKIVSRDRPWDFHLEFSNAENLLLEITSIAEDESQFLKFKYEERMLESTQKDRIELHELIKLNYQVPDDEISGQIELYKQQLGKRDKVPNPYYRKQFIFQSRFTESILSFDGSLRGAIDKKVAKNHPNKHNVILIIDNRTVSFSLEEILEHLDAMDDYFENLPFKEVWLYTGYYSDNDGNNAEYSLSPLKISDEKRRILEEKLGPE